MGNPTCAVTLELSFEAIESPDVIMLLESLQQHEMICARPVWSATIDHKDVEYI